MINKTGRIAAESAIDKSILAPIYWWLLKNQLQPELIREKSLYYYRRLVIESTEKLDSPIDRHQILAELRWLFDQKREEKSTREIASLYAVCEEGTFGQ